MSAARDTSDLLAVAAQGDEHVARLRELLDSGAPPDVAALKRAIGATRAVRGGASLLGLDDLQGYLGRLFQLLEDVESGEVPWSARLHGVLREAETAEDDYLRAIEAGEARPDADALKDVEARLAAWRRPGVQLQEVRAHDAVAREMSQSAVSGGLHLELEATVQQVQRLRLALENQTFPAALSASQQQALEREIARLQQLLSTRAEDDASGPERSQEGLRNHCEGALRHLVEAAAQEVLNEARERGVRLALRVTGHLDPVDEELGAALLEVLCNLWSDCLDVQSALGSAEIDTMLRHEDQRLVIEVCDPLATVPWAGSSDDDVLGRHPGLRRSRPLVEALHGLVWVEPAKLPGCRFRLSLPLSVERPHAILLRIGQHDVALAPSAIDGVYAGRSVRVSQDGAGPFVEVEGARVPILHLAFVLADVTWDELLREHIVVVGSFERRAALFVSGAQRAVRGELHGEAQGIWAGTLESEAGAMPFLHVGALLGRTQQAAPVVQTAARTAPAAASRTAATTVLVVDSAEGERDTLRTLLGDQSCTVVAVQSAEEAWKALQHQPIDLVVCDLRLPEMNAQQIAERRRQSGEFAQVPMLLVLSHAGDQSHLVVQQLGARAFVRSPVQRDELLGMVKRLTA